MNLEPTKVDQLKTNDKPIILIINKIRFLEGQTYILKDDVRETSYPFVDGATIMKPGMKLVLHKITTTPSGLFGVFIEKQSRAYTYPLSLKHFVSIIKEVVN